jgi:RecA/RadA recombinase
MAKKTNISQGKGKSIFDIVKGCDANVEVLAESKHAVIPDYINTGCYILNAAMTGSLFKGVPASRVVTLCGESGVGKSYLAISVCREAQKKGYTPIYMDSEGAIDREFVERLGCDSSNFMIKQVTTITEVSSFMANILKEVNEMPEEQKAKVIFVLDSLGNLTSAKELSDTIDANQKRDMTKQQEIKALFRTNATALARAGAVFIVNSHVYKTQDLFAKTIVSGGCLVADEEIIMSDGTTKKIQDVKKGDFVLTADGTNQEVMETFSFEKPTIKFTFDDNRTIECSCDHRFLVFDDISKETSWKKAKDLNPNDTILEFCL